MELKSEISKNIQYDKSEESLDEHDKIRKKIITAK